MNRRLVGAITAVCLALAVLLPLKARAQTAATYQLTDSALVVHQVHGFSCIAGPPTLLCLAYTPVDASGNPFGVSSNPFFVAPAAGQTFNVNCTSGCSGSGGGGLSVAYGGAIGANGTPGGFKDGSGNFQSLLGDTTNG